MKALLLKCGKYLVTQILAKKRFLKTMIISVMSFVLFLFMLPFLILEVAKNYILEFFDNPIEFTGDAISDWWNDVDDDLTKKCMQNEKESIIVYYMVNESEIELKDVFNSFEKYLVDYDKDVCIYPTEELATKTMKYAKMSEEDSKSLHNILNIYEKQKREYTLILDNGFIAYENYVTACYGWYAPFGERKFHTGIDLAPIPENKTLTPVLAYQNGVVTTSKFDKIGGHYVIIDHGEGITTYYGHLAELGIVEGTEVVRGQQIGIMGTTGSSTGIHVHFSIRKNGIKLNPAKFIPISPRGKQCSLDA